MDELTRQAGVIARAQLLEAGHDDAAIRRMVRRRELTRIHPGVYVDHTGPPTWLQRAWAAVLYAAPGALCGESALRAAEGPGRRDRDESVIHVAVERGRRVVAPDGIVAHRMQHLHDRVLWNTSPPRLRYEEAALDVAIDADSDFAALGILAAAVQSRRTTATRLLVGLEARPYAGRRRWLHDVLVDVAEGTCSVLEHGYLTRVERPHGLPRPRRQQVAAGASGRVYRDVEYDGGLIVELDGRLFHDSARQRDRDFDRDLDAAVDGRASIRLSWGQVFDRACATASKVATLLQRRGWRGQPKPCGPSCTVSR
ncbi:MAG TPA: type IV toxin-antitoxin system AbiEi family antitoxin domain-containing protein [Nocardioidaceae bacterium]|nr:type IV toxin-antitoxin system AbiEi family antitoxin domain-containing protein [Nocardioidaceae bacterium]